VAGAASACDIASEQSRLVFPSRQTCPLDREPAVGRSIEMTLSRRDATGCAFS